MIRRPRLRKLALTLHVVSSVGWLGAVVVFLALGFAGLTSQDAQVVTAVYLAMEPAGWIVLVPFSLASLLTGLVQSLGGKWGLLRHYWVVMKLIINVLAGIVLLLYMQTLGFLADVASRTDATDANLSGLRSASPVLHAGAGLLLLLAAAALSVYKPRGMTRYGQRQPRSNFETATPASSTSLQTGKTRSTRTRATTTPRSSWTAKCSISMDMRPPRRSAAAKARNGTSRSSR